MAKKKRNKIKDIIVVIISILLIIGSICAMVWAAWKYYFKEQKYFEQSGTINQDTDLIIDEGHDDYGKSKTFLFVGLDESEMLTDVMMIVNFDIEKNEMHILHIPRDAYVGYTQTGKMNSIYNSEYYKDKDPDISNIGKLIRMVNSQYKIGIDYYATITLSAFRDVVDAAGGIPIDLKWTINYDAEIRLKPGKQVLNGKEAEAMIRFRAGYNNADIGRMQARSYFLSACFTHFKDIGLTKAVKILETLVNDNPGEFTTNMSLGEMKDYLGLASKLTSDSVFVHTVPTESVGTYDDRNPRYGQSILSMWKDETADILNEYFRPYSDPVPGSQLGIKEIVNTGVGYTEDPFSFTEVGNGEASKPREN